MLIMPPRRDCEPNLTELVASARVVGARRSRSERIQNPLSQNHDNVETSYAQMAIEIDQPPANPIEGTQGVVAGHDDRVLNLIHEVAGLVREQRQRLQPVQQIAPPPFKGSTNPDDVELWIEEMEKAFDAMRSSDQDKWKGVARTHDNDPEFFNWENFRTAFYAKYFPRSKLLQLEREFLNLVQGSMTVDDYEAEFDRLSKFAIALVSDDESKARRFENGLNAHIRRGLAPLHLISYNEVVGRAKSLDAVWRETQEARKDFQKKRGRDSDFRGKRAFSSPSKFQTTEKSRASATFKDRLPPRGTQSYHGKTSQQGLRCSVCGGGHRAAECRRVTGACFRCGQLGRRIADCPLVLQESQFVQRPQNSRTFETAAQRTQPTHILEDLRRMDIGVRVHGSGALLANLQVQPTLIHRIKTTQADDPRLQHIKLGVESDSQKNLISGKKKDRGEGKRLLIKNSLFMIPWVLVMNWGISIPSSAV
ncbi:hypothetical protein SCA6_018536 [Theobroma cacao]